eukprot:3857184-Prymnesium_polylepis.1
MRVYLDADFSHEGNDIVHTLPADIVQDFAVTVRFASPRGLWAFQASMSVSANAPRRHELLGYYPVFASERFMVGGDQLNMTLVHATWSQSPGPGRGVDDWPYVHTSISNVRMCATELQSPAPPSPPTSPPGVGRRLHGADSDTPLTVDSALPLDQIRGLSWTAPPWRHVERLGVLHKRWL